MPVSNKLIIRGGEKFMWSRLSAIQRFSSLIYCKDHPIDGHKSDELFGFPRETIGNEDKRPFIKERFEALNDVIKNDPSIGCYHFFLSIWENNVNIAHSLAF